MKLKNTSARLYGIGGKLYAPLQEFELTSELDIASVQLAIDSGDLKVMDDVTDVEEKPRRGRPAKQTETTQDVE